MSLKTVEDTANELVDVRERIKELQAREKTLSGSLKTAFAGKVSGMVGNVHVDIQEVKGRTTYDYKAMIDDGMDLDPYKKVGNPTLRLSVKRVNQL